MTDAGVRIDRQQEGTVAAAVPARTGDSDHDVLRYPSMPIRLTQPSHLAALATLHGRVAPDVRCARVLEFGCASGGNLIPLAARFPQARFTGIDISAGQIRDGQDRIAALGLSNIELVHGDIAAANFAGQQFDYVICHGVFSWVPRAVQDAIFQTCKDTLAPDGVATISYNVLPGWHLRAAVRDLCLHYAGKAGTPLQRVRGARAALDRIAEDADPAEPYGMILRAEARRLKSMPSAYILGEFLAADNAPCTVQDFVGRAGQHDLDYLCDADLGSGAPQLRIAPLQDSIAADRLAAEQHMDFVTGRPFRRSVLVRRPAGCPERAVPRPSCLRTLHFCAGPTVLDDKLGRPAATSNPVLDEALRRLVAAHPATLSFEALMPGGLADHDEAEARLLDALLLRVMRGQVGIASIPLHVGSATDSHPRVSALARLEAQVGQPWISSRSHVGIPVSPAVRAMLPFLDGRHDQDALRARLDAASTDGAGALPGSKAGSPGSPQCRQPAVAEGQLRSVLRYLAQHGVLEPAPPASQATHETG